MAMKTLSLVSSPKITHLLFLDVCIFLTGTLDALIISDSKFKIGTKKTQ